MMSAHATTLRLASVVYVLDARSELRAEDGVARR